MRDAVYSKFEHPKQKLSTKIGTGVLFWGTQVFLRGKLAQKGVPLEGLCKNVRGVENRLPM